MAADFSPLDDSIMPPPTEAVPYEFTISQADVERKLSQINVHKAPGPDGCCAISVLSLRHLQRVSARRICSFVLKRSEIVPVPKVHPPRDNEADLRPFSLTLGKVLESFVGAWILERVGSTIDDRQ